MEHLTNAPRPGDARGLDSRSEADLRSDSRELAEQDGRVEARDSDRVDAASSAAFATGEISAPELSAGTEDLVTWDVSPDDAGHLVEDILTDDEADVPAAMAAQGRDDAERELRRASHANTG